MLDNTKIAEGTNGNPSTEDLHAFLIQWCNDNPYIVYAHYDDRLPIEWLKPLLQAKTKAELEAAQCELECNVWDHLLDYQFTIERDAFKQALDELATSNPQLAILLDNPEQHETAFEYFRENFQFLTQDYIVDCARNTCLEVVAVPLLNGEIIESPQDAESLEDFKTNVAPVFGFSDADCEALVREQYGVMKICGRVDFAALLLPDTKPFTHIKITPADNGNYVFHNAFDGSGACFEPIITKEVELPCVVKIDTGSRYGVQSTYGFTSAFWNNKLQLTVKE